MKPRKDGNSTAAFEKALAHRSPEKCLLRLYVAGATAKSHKAILCARQLCETAFNGNCKLEVIDVYQQPILAREGQIVATPTLVRELPRPVRRVIGNLADKTRVFVGLDLPMKPESLNRG